jgi:hypothetical protein
MYITLTIIAVLIFPIAWRPALGTCERVTAEGKN